MISFIKEIALYIENILFSFMNVKATGTLINWNKLHENRNVHAILKVIILCEHGKISDDVFYTHFGGSKTYDLSKHPRKVIKKGGYESSAFGAFQIIKKTDDELITLYGQSKSYSPEEQIKKGIALIEKKRKAMSDVLAGKWDNVLEKLAPEWASLPCPSKGYKSYYKQPSKGKDYFYSNLNKFLKDF